jgi:NTE family protein
MAVPDTDDGLAVPIDFEARRGGGADRTIVLGGGGVFFVAWQVAYLKGLAERGVDLGRAEIVVGTSAGSIVASILTAGRLRRFGTKVELIAKVPALISAMAPAGKLHPSQARARDLFTTATDARPETIRAIGFAALAADATSATQMRRSIGIAMAVRTWRSDALRVSTVDTYTGERLVIRREHGFTLPHAAAASASVPGLFQPQPLGDRRVMDGGVSGSGLHCDLVAGATRTLVLSLVGVAPHDAGMTSSADGQRLEIEALRHAGTRVHVAGPESFTLEQLMDPGSAAAALSQGEQQAARDAPELVAFWSD